MLYNKKVEKKEITTLEKNRKEEQKKTKADGQERKQYPGLVHFVSVEPYLPRAVCLCPLLFILILLFFSLFISFNVFKPSYSSALLIFLFISHLMHPLLPTSSFISCTLLISLQRCYTSNNPIFINKYIPVFSFSKNEPDKNIAFLICFNKYIISYIKMI